MTVKPTIEANVATGHVVTAAEWNTNVLQEALYVQEVLAGTNADKIPGGAIATSPTIAGTLTADALVSGTTAPLAVAFNAGSWTRASSLQQAFIAWNASNAGAEVSLIDIWNGAGTILGVYGYTSGGARFTAFTVDSAGTLGGKGFYASAEVAITGSGGGANFAHGLGARPRFVMGWYHGSTGGPYTLPVTPGPGAYAGASANIYIDSCDATNLHVVNNTGATAYVVTYAML